MIKMSDDIQSAINNIKQRGFILAALEQTTSSILLPDYRPPNKLALLVGREVEGIEIEILEACDCVLEIPMFGSKESFNVSNAAAMALCMLRFSA